MIQECRHLEQIINKDGYTVCADCGEVIDKESYVFTSYSDKEKTYSIEFAPPMGARTTFIPSDRIYYRLYRINESKNTKEKIYLKIYNEIRRYDINKSLKINSLNTLKKVILSSELKLGARILVEATIYYYLRKDYHIPMADAMNEINIYENDLKRLKREIWLGLKFLNQIKYKGKKLIDLNKINENAFENYIRYFGSKLNLDIDQIEKMIKQSQLIKPFLKPGYTTLGYVGALIYYNTKEKMNQKYIAKVLSITDITIRSRLKELETILRCSDLANKHHIDDETGSRIISKALKKIHSTNMNKRDTIKMIESLEEKLKAMANSKNKGFI